MSMVVCHRAKNYPNLLEQRL